jgi:hypothetical protein
MAQHCAQRMSRRSSKSAVGCPLSCDNHCHVLLLEFCTCSPLAVLGVQSGGGTADNSATYCSSGRKPGRGQVFARRLLCSNTISLPSYVSSSMLLVLHLKYVTCGLLPVPLQVDRAVHDVDGPLARSLHVLLLGLRPHPEVSLLVPFDTRRMLLSAVVAGRAIHAVLFQSRICSFRAQASIFNRF